VASFTLCSPLAWETIPELSEIVSDPYNPPPPGSDERHQGVDFSHYSRKGRKTIEGEPVQAVLAGRAAAVIADRLPYGNMVMIETPYMDLPAWFSSRLDMAEGQSPYLLYAHFGHAPLVKLGDWVDCGQEIGDVGKTGYNIVNPHLHLETRLGPAGVTFESMAFYTTSASEQEMENYKRWRTGGEFKHFDPMNLFALYRQPEP
jgi:murein DD-endopeptidase MepM/ murein hydrolase activator NlpD